MAHEARERLWSPQMRKWARDAHRHGLFLEYETKPNLRREAGASVMLKPERITDSIGNQANARFLTVTRHHTTVYVFRPLHQGVATTTTLRVLDDRVTIRAIDWPVIGNFNLLQ